MNRFQVIWRPATPYIRRHLRKAWSEFCDVWLRAGFRPTPEQRKTSSLYEHIYRWVIFVGPLEIRRWHDGREP